MIGQTFSNYVIKVFNLKLCTELYHAKKWLHDQKVIYSLSCEMCKEEKVDDIIFGMYLKIGGIEPQHILFN